MGFFSDDKPKVTKDEFRKYVRNSLSSKGFSTHEIDEVEKIFMADMLESSSYESGIDSKELDRTISWLRANKSKHHFSDSRIDTIESALRSRL